MFRSCVFVVSMRERDINRSYMRESSSFLGVWSLFSFVCKKMKNGTSFFLHSFVDVGVKKDIRRERDEFNLSNSNNNNNNNKRCLLLL